MWLVARTEDLQRIKKKILENGRKRALKGPKIKISKNKKLRFFLMSQGVLCQKIRFLGQKLWPVAREQTDRHTHTEYPILCLWYKRSNYWQICNTKIKVLKPRKLHLTFNTHFFLHILNIIHTSFINKMVYYILEVIFIDRTVWFWQKVSLKLSHYSPVSTAPAPSTGWMIANNCPGRPLVWNCQCQLRQITILITFSITFLVFS